MSKIAVRPLRGDTFYIEVEASDTVSDLKRKAAVHRPDIPLDLMKMIHSGRVLKDATTVEELNIKPEEFVVVMATKPKPAVPEAPAAAAAAASTPSGAEAGQAAPEETPAPAAPQPLSVEAASSNVVAPSGLEATINQLCEMGFERPQVERCMQAAFNNPDRAVEYLMSGIPAGQGGALQGTEVAGGQGQGQAARGTPLPPALEELRNNPRFGQIAMLVAQDQTILNQIMPALAQSNPAIVQAIQEHPEEFMRMLQEAVEDPAAAMSAETGGEGQLGGAQPPQGQTLVHLTNDEMAAVDRLCALGFSRDQAAQAYIACDRNEELAANLLFDGGADMED